MAPPNKRRKTDSRVEEISFDPEARADYLTGFRKRKQQRIKHAQEENAKKERALKVESRKHLREQRRRDLEAHVQTVNTMLKKARKAEDSDESSDDGEDGDVETETADLPMDDIEGRQDEYIDEEKYTTVTIEPMKLSDEEESSADEADGDDGEASRTPTEGLKKEKRVWTKDKPAGSKPKKKKKKFRYESKVERKATRSKQATKNSAAARARREGKN